MTANRRWRAQEDAVLRRDYGKVPAAAIARKLKRSENAIGQRASKLKLDSGRFWSPAEDDILRRRFADEPTAAIAHDLGRKPASLASRARVLGLRKSRAYMDGAYREDRRRMATLDPRIAATQFQPGQEPPNKGLRRPGFAPGRMAATQFKRGSLSGSAAAKLQPIGALRIIDGSLQKKVNHDRPIHRRWVAVARLVWEAANGPIPKAHVVRFQPGMATVIEAEITLDRLELITQVENMRRNSYHTNYPREVGLAIQAKAVLSRAINTATRGSRRD